jgi:uncharacterized membrane protein YraQ (UPF0718 family)
MLLAASIIWPIVVICSIALWNGPRSRRRQALTLAQGNAVFMALRMPFAMLGAGFAGTLLPADLVAEWLGGASGWKGILIASAVGGFVPSGPIVSFPFALALAKAGVGVPQLVAFLTSWSLLSVHTFLAWEIPVLGVRFPAVRYACSLVLPPIAGFLAALMAV